MSIDKSLVTKGKLARHRNVLTRAERVKFLINESLWEDGRSVFGLPKVNNVKVRKAAKAEKEKTEETEEAAAAPTGEEKKEKAP